MSKKLKFSLGKNNSKLAKLEKATGKKVYSFSLLSGWNCPGANECFAKVVMKDGRRKLKHGKDQKFTCFSAVEENAFTNTYKARKHNTDLIKECKTTKEIVALIKDSFPKDAEIVRWHVAGDWSSQKYFDAGLEIAKLYPYITFYSYTKSIPFWLARFDDIPDNFILTASFGGRFDSLIHKHGLRYSKVVFSEEEAEELGLKIDDDDTTASLPSKKEVNLALLLHGRQQKGTEAAEALKVLNRKKKGSN